MPISEYYHGHGTEVKHNMEKEYGPKKGEEVFYATANKRGEKPGEDLLPVDVYHIDEPHLTEVEVIAADGSERELVGTHYGHSIFKVKTPGGAIRYTPKGHMLKGGLYLSVEELKHEIEAELGLYDPVQERISRKAMDERLDHRELGKQGRIQLTSAVKVGNYIDYYDRNGDKQYGKVVEVSGGSIVVETGGKRRRLKTADEEIQPVAVSGSKPSKPAFAQEVQEYVKTNPHAKVGSVASHFGLTPEEAREAMTYTEPYHNVHPVPVKDEFPGQVTEKSGKEVVTVDSQNVCMHCGEETDERKCPACGKETYNKNALSHGADMRPVAVDRTHFKARDNSLQPV